MGEFAMKETLEVVLAAAAIALLIFLLFRIIGNFNEEDEAAKALFERLMVAVDEAERGYVGEIEWVYPKYQLVYFGDSSIVECYQSASYIVPKGENKICVCYYEYNSITGEDDAVCNYCENLDSPIQASSGFEIEFANVFPLADTVKIQFVNDAFRLSRSSGFVACGGEVLFDELADDRPFDVKFQEYVEQNVDELSLPPKEELTENILISRFSDVGIDLNNWQDVNDDVRQKYCNIFFEYMGKDINIGVKSDRDLYSGCVDDGLVYVFRRLVDE